MADQTKTVVCLIFITLNNITAGILRTADTGSLQLQNQFFCRQ